MRAVSSVFALLFVTGCSSAPGPSAVASSRARSPRLPLVEVRDPAPATDETRRSISTDALAEGPGSRDPFRASRRTGARGSRTRARARRSRSPSSSSRRVALVTNTRDPRAKPVDPSGKDYIVKVGELVGRPEPSTAPGDRAHRTASYRVDRIRQGSVVLVREDADAPPTTRVLSLPRDPPPARPTTDPSGRAGESWPLLRRWANRPSMSPRVSSAPDFPRRSARRRRRRGGRARAPPPPRGAGRCGPPHPGAR